MRLIEERKSQSEPRVRVCCMTPRDRKRVLAIDRVSYDWPWTDTGLDVILSEKHTYGFVAELNNVIVGYVVFQMFPDKIFLLRCAVDPYYRRQGIGRLLIAWVIERLNKNRRYITQPLCDVIGSLCCISERNLVAQLFLRACGFRMTKVLNSYIGNDDGYHFEFWGWGEGDEP